MTAVVAIAAALLGCATPGHHTVPPVTRSPAPPPAVAPSPVTLDAPIAHPDPEARRYLEDLRAAIRRGWKYPCVADPSTAGCVRPEGTVALEFAIAPDGWLASANVTKTSGYPELDAAATRAVKSAAPFPPVPLVLKQRGGGFSIRVNMKYVRRH